MSQPKIWYYYVEQAHGYLINVNLLRCVLSTHPSRLYDNGGISSRVNNYILALIFKLMATLSLMQLFESINVLLALFMIPFLMGIRFSLFIPNPQFSNNRSAIQCNDFVGLLTSISDPSGHSVSGRVRVCDYCYHPRQIPYS